jgi:hypothetical protein
MRHIAQKQSVLPFKHAAAMVNVPLIPFGWRAAQPYISPGIFRGQRRLDQQFERLPDVTARVVRTLNAGQRRFANKPLLEMSAFYGSFQVVMPSFSGSTVL